MLEHKHKILSLSIVSANKITNEEQLLLENKVNSVQSKVFINNVKTGETTKAYQNITTYPDGSMSILQKNLTTGEISFQGINSSGQRVFEKTLTPYEANTLIGANSSSKMLVGNGAVSQSVISTVSYQTGNNSLVLYDKTPVPVTTKGTLVPPLTTNRALATVPLLTDGANQVVSKLPYNPVLKSPIKYPNLNYDENKFLNDYMGKEMPGKVTSKYGDVRTYRYADVVDNNKNTSMANQNQISNITIGTNKSGINQGVTNTTQKAISANTKQNVKPLIISDGTLNNGTKYVVIKSSSEKIKSIDELLTKEGQAKLPNTSMEELEIIAQKEGYETQFINNTRGTGQGQRLIIIGHKSIGSIRSNSEGTHEMKYKVVSGSFKDINNNPLPGKIKVLEGKPEEYHTRGNTPEKVEMIFVEKKEENK